MAEHVSRSFLFRIKRAGRYARAGVRASRRGPAIYYIYIYFVAQIKPRYLLIADLAIALVDAGDERRKNNPTGSLLLSNYLGEIIAGFSEKLYIQSREELARLYYKVCIFPLSRSAIINCTGEGITFIACKS